MRSRVTACPPIHLNIEHNTLWTISHILNSTNNTTQNHKIAPYTRAMSIINRIESNRFESDPKASLRNRKWDGRDSISLSVFICVCVCACVYLSMRMFSLAFDLAKLCRCRRFMLRDSLWNVDAVLPFCYLPHVPPRLHSLQKFLD